MLNLIYTFFDYIYAVYIKIMSSIYTIPTHPFDPKKPTVIFIPGVYENWYFFRHLAKVLQETYNILYGEVIYRPKSIREDARAIADYIHKNNLTNVTLVGHSSGGLTAIKCMSFNDTITQTIAIATPFFGVKNGHVVRTKKVRELLPSSSEIKSMNSISKSVYKKVVSVYPAYDNQVWSSRGSVVPYAQNIELSARGHHLILRSRELAATVHKLIDRDEKKQKLLLS